MAKSLAVERPYETLLVCPSDTPQKSIDEFVEKIKKVVTSTGGSLRGVQVWGRRRLTYPIKRQKEGLYVYVDFNGSNTAAAELNNLFRLSDLVLRHLTTDRKEIRARPDQAAAATDAAAAGSTPAAAASPATGTTSIKSEAPSAPKEA